MCPVWSSAMNRPGHLPIQRTSACDLFSCILPPNDLKIRVPPAVNLPLHDARVLRRRRSAQMHRGCGSAHRLPLKLAACPSMTARLGYSRRYSGLTPRRGDFGPPPGGVFVLSITFRCGDFGTSTRRRQKVVSRLLLRVVQLDEIGSIGSI